MYCSRCGFQNEPGSVFCSKCGAPIEPAAPPAGQAPSEMQWPPQDTLPPQDYTPQQDAPPQDTPPPQGYAPPQDAPPQGYAPPPGYAPPLGYAPPKKKRTGLVVGLILGAVALVGALAAVYFLFLSGPNFDGTWVCEERGWVLEISGDKLTEYSPAGTNAARYSISNGEGEVRLQDGKASFTVANGRLNLTDEESGDKYLFMRAENGLDIEETVLAGFEGLWSSEELGEVLKVGDDGTLSVYSGGGDLTGSIDFNVDRGRGTISLNSKEYTFTAGWDELEVADIGAYKRADRNLDVEAFLDQYANPLIATWYETTGTLGAITFSADGTYSYELYGQTFTGTYTYSPEDGAGDATMDSTGETMAFSYEDGKLAFEDATFTKEYVTQPGAADIYEAVAGDWYEATGIDETLTFNSDGTVDIDSAGEIYAGTFTYNPVKQTGVITIEAMGQTQDFDFYLAEGTLVIEDYTYTREQTTFGGTSDDSASASILGTWYDIAGMQGTLYFDKDGMALMDSYGTMFSGTYTFDDETGMGTMTLDYVEGPYTWNLIIWGDYLYTDDTMYTKDYVEQTDNTDVS